MERNNDGSLKERYNTFKKLETENNTFHKQKDAFRDKSYVTQRSSADLVQNYDVIIREDETKNSAVNYLSAESF